MFEPVAEPPAVARAMERLDLRVLAVSAEWRQLASGNGHTVIAALELEEGVVGR